ncbi:MAG: GNAT family protein [Acidimicrobiia bacterium]|jgi:RimJ/RimL family protein N-acetyltransferase
MPQNEYGQPIGEDLGRWQAPSFPMAVTVPGRTVTLEPLSSDRHGEGLWAALGDAPTSLWTYMSFGPFADRSEFQATIDGLAALPDWVPYALVVEGAPLGFASYLRVQPADGVLEIGSIVFSPQMQRTTPATESLYLMIARTFELGYRRCEWKCDALNGPSRQAADRLGFTYEGTFRHATHYKGRNRDTSWYAIIDRDWPELERAFELWMSADNFDVEGNQIRSLRELRGAT